ncbi:sigma factor-like helix-turn-helix DNA-binding protein [Pseudoalteromonas sp. GB43]
MTFNFGKKSAKDFCKLLLIKLRKFFDKPAHIPNGIPDKVTESVGEQSLAENSIEDIPDKTSEPVGDQSLGESSIEDIPLKQHFENSMATLTDKARLILQYRTAYREPIKTLDEIGGIIGVSRERIRQIQKMNIDKIIRNEYWDDLIAIKIGNLLIDRIEPLYLEMLEVEDKWFAGFIGNYRHLAAIIKLFSENQIQLLTINDAVVISRVNQDNWDNLISGFRKSLKAKAGECRWTKDDINLIFKAELENRGAVELLPVLWSTFDDSLQFNTEDKVLIAYGKTGESAVYTVLQQAEAPLHYSEVAVRATAVMGRKVEERLAHGSLPKLGAKLFGRGIYGLPKFNPISDLICKHIRTVVSKMMYEGPLAKQWHVTELLSYLKEKFPSLPEDLNLYILNIILEDCDELTYLNKNVWARADSGQKPTDSS